ncbi:MAG: DUF2807 domain-containing protein [Hyphomonadaceae bacterium]
MRQALLIVIPSLAALASSGCVVGGANGAPYAESQRHTYTGFEKVDVSAGVEVIASQGPFDVKAETTSGGNFDNLIVEVRGNTLHVSRKSTMFSWGGPHYRVTVAAPTYSSFGVSSGASLESGALQLANLEVDVSSGGSLQLVGACASLDASVSSGGHFSGEALKCETAEVNASSGGHADAFATRTAEGNASSGAHVTFYGNPAQIQKDSSSGGSIDAR